jgi:hypothetical protein
MKTLTLIFSVLITISVFSQSPYKLYSKVWTLKNVNDTLRFFPIDNSGYFKYEKLDSINKKINMNIVNSNLLKSFNEFRTDYGSPVGIENSNLSLSCKEYSKKLSVSFKHDDSSGPYIFECITKIPLEYFSNVKPSDGDLNKIVSDCVFDAFVKSKPHMNFLLDKDYTVFGFGLYNNGDYLYIVVRGR